MCTENIKITIAIVNYETNTLTNACIKSIIKNVKKFDYRIIILDNSHPHKKFILDNKISTNIKILDNTNERYIKFKKIINTFNLNINKLNAAFKHSYSIQFLINICTTDILVIIDSDALLYKDLDFIDNNVITCADIQNEWLSPTDKVIRYTRFIPFIQSFNIKIMAEKNIKYFNKNAIIGYENDIAQHYDTGSFFYEQVIKQNIPYKKIFFPFYIKHLGSGSERKNKNENCFLKDNLSCYCDDIKIDVIVSITTWYKRYKKLIHNIQSIEKQIFNGHYDFFITLCDDDINDFPFYLKFYIAQSKIKLLHADKNIRAHKKYFYIMLKDKTHPIITLDDDCIYSPFVVQKLYDEYLKDKTNVIAFRTHMMTYDKNRKILPYCRWKQKIFNSKPSYDLFATGVGGVLYPPDCLNIRSNDIELVYKFINNDDFFLKTKELINEIKVKSIIFNEKNPTQYPYVDIDLNDKDSLYFSENLNGGNDKLIKLMNNMNLTKIYLN